MGAILDGLRSELDLEATTDIFGRKRYKIPKDGSLLYLSARMRDAENKTKKMEKLADATEMAAIDIIRRFDGNGDLINEFKQQIEERKRYLS
jgi:hypothetical protein